MKVRLISYTQPDNIIGVDDAQELIAYCARVSNPGNQNNKQTSEKLVKYLIKNKHWSPLEMVNACIEIETTRDIARQILRHRSFSFQEFSQRYADPTKDLTFETRDARLQDPTNRQNSVELDFTMPAEKDFQRALADRRLNENFRMKQMDVWREVVKTYEWAIENGIAKEQARAVLPEV